MSIVKEHPTRNRYERIRKRLEYFAKRGIIKDYTMTQSSMPGKRWHIIPCGFSERSMSTNEIEWFIIGVEATLNSMPLQNLDNQQ